MEYLGYLGLIAIMFLGYWLWLRREDIRKEKHQKLYDECMIQQEENRQKIRNKFEQDRRKRERYMQECRQCVMWSQACSNLILKFSKEIPDDVFKDFYLQEGHTAYLPLEIGPLVKDSPYRYLMRSAVFENPVIIKTFPTA